MKETPMKLTNKSLKLAGVLSLALIGASPLALSTAADAAPMKPVAMQQHNDRGQQFAQNDRDGRGGNIKVANNSVTFRFGYDAHRYNDRFHKPPPKFERIAQPHFARHFHQGHWQFQYGHWTWVKGFWTR
jgi:hypothetical protein